MAFAAGWQPKMDNKYSLVEEQKVASDSQLPLVANNSVKLKSLKQRNQFLNLKEVGRRVYFERWLVINYSPSHEGLELGCTIPRYVGKAVTRNRLRRWTREITREWLKKSPAFSAKVNVVFRKMDPEFYKNLTYELYKQALWKCFKKVK
ncbi:MAG: hypothetical protein CL677_08290 [Bdellovibrionaceae bacterium]|nr:hypothetical protein [Pseudobdellovibrionaceae bacterium]|tara:strand:+ start:128574 stop:129020 length:447 start_codon:yes stop_codon:yes gene_type:complete